MLRSGAGRLYKGVVRAVDSLITDGPTITTLSSHQLSLSINRQSRRPAPRSTSSANAATRVPTALFHSESYFSASPPEFPSSVGHPDPLKLERFLPPLLDIVLNAQNEVQEALFTAIQQLDADRSWQLYRQLGKSRHSLSTAVIDLLITLQCRIPVRSSPANVIDSRAAVRQVCDRILSLCHDRLRNQPGSSSRAITSANEHDGLSTLPAALSLRLLYLLIIEEEQVAASKSRRPSRRRNSLSGILSTLSANVDARHEPGQSPIDFELRGRLAASLSRLGATDAAYRHLELVVKPAACPSANAFIDPRPFDQLLSALAKQANTSTQAVQHLPSPVDSTSNTIKEDDPIIRALRLTVSYEISASKANIHRCLQALDSVTLWWLLPFELDSDHSHGASSATHQPDNRLSLKQKWHPWQISADQPTISQESLDSFAERVALVLAQRGILQPALHIVDGLQVTHQGNNFQSETQSTRKIPDHDFFTVVLEKLAERMASSFDSDARSSLDRHRGLSADLHLAFKVYTTAHAAGVDLDSRLNLAVVNVLASCLPSAVADLGPSRSRHTKISAQLARRNEEHGSKQALKQYLRQFTTMVLGSDPDLSKGSLSYPAQATLLGLHMRTRDYSFSKRLYQPIRLRDSDRELWSFDPKAGSLQYAALHPLSAPDRDAFTWFFAESLRFSAKTVFAVQLHLDWIASGNVMPSSLNAMFVRSLLRAGLIPVVRRVLHELEVDRSLLPARLARSLVVSFAEAGYPDLAMELVVNVSQLTSPTYLSQRGKVDKHAASGSRDTWILVSTLKLMSVALEHSSKAPAAKDGELHRKVLRLFEEFRLGLTHHLFINMAQSKDASQAQAPTAVSLRDVRMAYNACIRASLSGLPTSFRVSEMTDSSDPDVSWDTTESTCLHVEELFNELRDLGVEPDDDSWNLQLTSSLHACFAAPDQAGRTEWLQKALSLFEHASKQVFKADGPLHGSEHNSSALDTFRSASENDDIHRVTLHPAVVAAIIDASRCCRDLESGLRVYELHQRRNGFNVHVEKARLTLLADLAEPRECRTELQRLTQQHKSAFRHSDRFMKHLHMLSCAAHNTGPR
ncbi:hypothetical protein EX895_001165 [Sporisorium graminicola]|uniref:Uncharacterized protein n=1 Tax=Sporisorium graminicola TaxID=280036 RepID=A0A4U7L235_9BASI|nr:hypothetical protein EX895_001165 [Sporisorium graminicola]TKY89868.1 hypothetical protein EX895_001165 [Sporisorium graminicola]